LAATCGKAKDGTEEHDGCNERDSGALAVSPKGGFLFGP